MLNGRETFKVSTRTNEDADPKETVITIVWDGCTDGVIRALARQSLIIKRQGQYRKNGVPEADEVHAKDYAPGTRHAGMTPEQAEALVLEKSRTDKAYREAQIKRLQELDAAAEQQ